MKAVVFDNKLKLADNYPVPKPIENEALIKISTAGICNTDIEITKGYTGFKGVIGHEFVGIVEKINGKDQSLLGKRIVGEINCGCGKCEYCKKGLKNHCPDRKVLGIVNKHGAFAEYITLPLENLHIVSENISDEEAVFTEPLAAAFEITRQIQIKPDDKILIMGDGKLGLLISLALHVSHSNLIITGRHENKLRIAKDKGIETLLFNKLSIKKDYDIVVEATGSAEGFETALKLVKPRGVIVLKSTVAAKKEINLAPVVVDEITVIGSRCGPFEPALDALSKKLIDVNPLITDIFPFDKAKEAFERAIAKDALKVIIDFR
ncbi:MAG: alcohol dehydrogenase catalytic domain-containing protein [Nitrospirae bacterium]|nr:alcohol dehydrogenase catalytic domain-containing protein [Nitrospirota bacterium]